jgi:hypothetical protein
MNKRERLAFKNNEVKRVKQVIMAYAIEEHKNGRFFNFPSHRSGDNDTNIETINLFNFFKKLLGTSSISVMRNAMRELVKEKKITKHNCNYYLNVGYNHDTFNDNNGVTNYNPSEVPEGDDEWTYKDEIEWKKGMDIIETVCENDKVRIVKIQRDNEPNEWNYEPKVELKESSDSKDYNISNILTKIITDLRSKDIEDFQAFLDADREKRANEYVEILENYEASLLAKDKEICNLRDMLAEHEDIRKEMVKERGNFLSKVNQLKEELSDKDEIIEESASRLNALYKEQTLPVKYIEDQLKIFEERFNKEDKSKLCYCITDYLK